MIQTGSIPLDALVKELEEMYLQLLEANLSKAAELAVLRDEKTKLEKELEKLRSPPT